MFDDMRYLLGAGNTLIVRGAASFRLLNGEASVLGAPLSVNISVVVRREKQLPILAHTESDLDVTLGQQGSVFEVDGSTIPSSWDSAAEALTQVEQGRIMVVGGTDVGKSTLCTYLANRLFKENVATTVVDGDIGQADIGPPTTVGRAIPRSYVSSLVDLTAETLFFVGHNTPNQVQAKLIEGIRRLSQINRQSLTIINTDGWVLDPEAVIYKIRMIEAIQPDIVLGISTQTELQPILSGSKAKSLRIEAPRSVLSRSRMDRRELRTAAYRRFLEGGKPRTFSLHDVPLKLHHGISLIRARRDLDLTNLIVGLLDRRGFLLQIGILLEIGENSLQLYCRPASEVREIEAGYVRLSTDGVELGYLDI